MGVTGPVRRRRQRSTAPLVVVSGPPASGKTTLAVPLASALSLPLVAKDTIKEALMDAVGPVDLERSKALGVATFAVMYALARSHLDTGAGLVLEANFASGVSEPELRPLVARSRAVLVHCWAPRDVLIERYRERAPHRHPGHHDLVRLDAGPWWLEPPALEPPELGAPCLRVDTSRPCEVEAITDWVRARLAG
ncbi:MAG TPA: AAA family ATPase [Terriglobales bacterium]|nr:AAA family ATPase [Terriglobales bacterium]